jgi:hypothetical protein
MPEARSVETLQMLLRELKPRVVALAKQAGVDLFVDRLGPNDTEATWEEAIRSGATGIQTDHPAGPAPLLAALEPEAVNTRTHRDSEPRPQGSR